MSRDPGQGCRLMEPADTEISPPSFSKISRDHHSQPFPLLPSNHFNNPDSVVTNALFLLGFFLETTVVEGSLLGLSALLETGDLCLVSLCSGDHWGHYTCITWSVQCSTTWHRLYCAVHCTVLSTPHQTIIGTSSPHGLDDK